MFTFNKVIEYDTVKLTYRIIVDFKKVKVCINEIQIFNLVIYL